MLPSLGCRRPQGTGGPPRCLSAWGTDALLSWRCAFCCWQKGKEASVEIRPFENAQYPYFGCQPTASSHSRGGIAAWLRSGWREAFPFCPPLPPPSSFRVSCWAIEMHFRKCVCMMCVHVSVCTPLVFWHIIAFLCFEEQDCKALEQ